MDMLSEHLEKTTLGERDLFCTNLKILQRRVNNLKKEQELQGIKKKKKHADQRHYNADSASR